MWNHTSFTILSKKHHLAARASPPDPTGLEDLLYWGLGGVLENLQC